MSHTTIITFGPLIAIKITRDQRRRISEVQSFVRNKEQGFRLEIHPTKQEGQFFAMPEVEILESYAQKKRRIHSEQKEQEDLSIEFSTWLQQCMQRLTSWAKERATQTAHQAVAEQDYPLAIETYRDILDHFPPPDDAGLLYWMYYGCLYCQNPSDEIKEYLYLWFDEALEISEENAVALVLEQGSQLMGKEKTMELARNWLKEASIHLPAYKKTTRWLIHQANDSSGQLQWESHEPKPFPSKYSSSINCPNGDIVLLGGLDQNNQPIASVAKWSLHKQSWTELPSMPFARFRHAAIALWDGSILVMGGTTVQNGLFERFSDSVLRYNPEKEQWEELPSLLIGREYLSATVFHGRVIVIGGESPYQLSTFAEIWDRRSKQWLKGAEIDARLRLASVQNYLGEILISGSSVSSSGFGILSLDPRRNQLQSLPSLQGEAFDGTLPMQQKEVLVWSRQNQGIKMGIWSPETTSLRWSFQDISIPLRDDLLQLVACEEDKYLLFYQRDDERCGIRLLHPRKSLMDELNPLEEHQLEYLSAILLIDGRVLLTDHLKSYIITA